ncbi:MULTISPECIES: hypothetical protein [unclassified Streptomyces]|uniref:hypothetical protein n=1 Tax=unclassified Streptomyces TaxID=2593676 RepID=UPI00224E7D18|nr:MULTISPECIES: hypothetical protein [unclassified Streptomyces]MCX5049117.1 hypothetical protein [Streptomyces sp. NBC_00474]MCX5056136.1 hypothetical protein [Streptomyces sp. NBC_00452]MCX5287241.1 hypothetical protein [Streptomyces sp. NBC_00183]
MFSRKKIAAVSGLLCGLAVTGVGVTQAHAAADPGACSVSLSGDVTCVQRVTGEMPEGGGFTIRKASTCTPVKPMQLPVIPLLNNGSTRIGPEVTCNPGATPVADQADQADKGEGGFELPGGLLS